MKGKYNPKLFHTLPAAKPHLLYYMLPTSHSAEGQAQNLLV